VGCRRATAPGVGIRPTELRKVSRGGFGRSVSLRPGDLISADCGEAMVGMSWYGSTLSAPLKGLGRNGRGRSVDIRNDDLWLQGCWPCSRPTALVY
jgi:hypothetical protein